MLETAHDCILMLTKQHYHLVGTYYLRNSMVKTTFVARHLENHEVRNTIILTKLR